MAKGKRQKFDNQPTMTAKQSNNKILSFIQHVTKLDLVKVFSFTAISTLVRMLTGLISVKVVASIIGPAGVALVGQLNNFATMALSLSTGGINGGITKYIAEYKSDDRKVKDCLSTAFKITIICSLLVGVVLTLFHNFLSESIMLSPDYGYVFIIFGLTILLYALNMGLTSVINGFKEFQKYVKVNIAGSIIGLVFTLSLVWIWKLKGALISAVTFQSIMLFISLWMIRKTPWLKWEYFKQKLNKDLTKKYLNYSLMTFVSASVGPISQMLLRGYVISEISATEAGWWEAMNRISNMYLMVITTSFSVYYLPRLSELSDKKELRNEIFRSYKVIIPCLLAGLTIVYLLRHFVIKLLFTTEFLPMENLFIWQLGGDLFKIASWLLSYLMVAKAMTKWFITTEVSFTFLFVGLGFMFMYINGVVGITQAYLINSIAYLSMMIFIFRKLLFYGK